LYVLKPSGVLLNCPLRGSRCQWRPGGGAAPWQEDSSPAVVGTSPVAALGKGRAQASAQDKNLAFPTEKEGGATRSSHSLASWPSLST